MSLPTQLLKLAHTKPTTRKHLLPLLRLAATMLTPEQEALWDKRVRSLTPVEREWARDHLIRHKGQTILGLPYKYGQRVEFNTQLWLVYDVDKTGNEKQLVLVSPDARELVRGVPVGMA